MKTNVLHIVDKYSYGGVETIIYSLIDSFTSETVELSYLFLRDLKNKEHINKSNVFIKNYAKFSFFKPLFEILKLINAKGIQVIHTHHRKGFYLAIILSFFFDRVQYIHHEHSDIVPNNTLYKIACNVAGNRGFSFVAVSNFLADLLLQKTNLKKESIRILPNFVDLQKYKPITKNERKIARKKLGLDVDDFVIGFAGRLIERKGWSDFVSACKYLDDRSLKFIALVAGDGPDLVDIKNIVVDSKLEDRIRLLGFCSEMSAFYALLDCYVISSYWEGLPMSQLEVMASGIPMITSNGPGLDEVCNGGFDCLYFDVKDYAMLALRIQELEQNSKLRILLKHNALNTIRNYSHKIYIAKVEALYSEILKSKS